MTTSNQEQEKLIGLTFNIIRGHRLVLWANRLNFHPDFVTKLDKHGMHYVQQIEQSDNDEYTLIVLAKLVNQIAPFAITFRCNGTDLQSLIEKVQVEPLHLGEKYEEDVV